MRFERMTSRLSAGCTTRLCYGPEALIRWISLVYKICETPGCNMMNETEHDSYQNR